jgi:hypothetical protein
LMDVIGLVDRRQRKNPPDLVDPEGPQGFFLTEPEPIEIASAYSISVKYDKDGKPMIYVKKYGDVDTKGLRREIERNYPGAHIQGLERPGIISVANDEKESGWRKPRTRRKQPL